MKEDSFKSVTEAFKEIYNEEFWERYENDKKYGKKWLDLEILYGNPEVIVFLKETKLGKLVT